MLLGSYLRYPLFGGIGGDPVLLAAISRDWRDPPPICPYVRAFYTTFSLVPGILEL